MVEKVDQTLPGRESSHALPHKPSVPLKASKKRKQNPSSKPSSAVYKVPRPRQPRQPRGSQKPGMQKKEDLSGVFSITKPNRLNRLESFEAKKTSNTSESTVGSAPYGLGQTYQAEYPGENAGIPTSNVQDKNGLADQSLQNVQYVSSITFQDALRKRKDCHDELSSRDRNVINPMDLLQNNVSVLLDSNPQDGEGLQSSKMHGNVKSNESPRNALGFQPNREKGSLTLIEGKKNSLNQLGDPNFDVLDNDEFPFDDEGFPSSSKEFYLTNEDFLLDENDDFQLNIDDTTFSSIDECFPWSDADLEEMIQLTDASHELGSSCFNQALKGTTSDPWLLEGDEDIDMLFSTYAFDSQKIIPYKDENSYGIATNEVDAVSSSPYLNFKCYQAEDIYEDDELENELSKITTTIDSGVQDSSLPAPSITPTKEVEPVSHTAIIPLRQASSSEKIGEIPYLVSFNTQGKPIPFVRPPFTKPIRDRSPILGLSSRMVLRVCFRIGEALNAAAIASRNNVDTVIELYACVMASSRETDSFKQCFTFADIFMHEKPPFLLGNYTLWRGVELWDHDSRAFLGENNKRKMARVIGRINRNEEKTGWIMTMMNIWQADWEDIGIAKGIVCP